MLPRRDVALTLYADQPNACDPEDGLGLTALAEDISYAVSRLRGPS